jgi:uncharacterized protein YigA (DUF484 family)
MTDNTPLHPITEEDIALYLSHNPEFFDRHAELLSSVQLVSPHSRRAVSLQERQAEMLREKIRLLERRVMEIFRHGTENLALSDKLTCLQRLPSRSALSLPCRRQPSGCGLWTASLPAASLPRG